MFKAQNAGIDRRFASDVMGQTGLPISQTKICSNTDGLDHGQELQLLVEHFRQLASHLGRGLEDADWNRRRDIIRTLIERIEIGHRDLAIIFRSPSNITVSKKKPLV